MNVRSIGAGILGIGLVAGVLTACGEDTLPTGQETSSASVSSSKRSSPPSSRAPATSAPATGSPVEVDGTAAPAPSPVDVDQPGTTAAPPPTIAPPPTTTPPDDGPHDLLGNIAIWTITNGDPLNGAAFYVSSCGDAEDIGPVDMSEQAYIDVPVSVGCWVVTLTRTPSGYTLDGPSERTVNLDAETNQSDAGFRFWPV